MIKLLITIIVCSNLSLDVTPIKEKIDFEMIEREIEWFIGMSKKQSVENGKYNIYLAKIIQNKENSAGYCLSLTYIQDSLFISIIDEFKYYLEIENELVLLTYNDEIRKNFAFENYHFKTLTDKNSLGARIYSEGFLLGTVPGYVICYENERIIKVFYKNAEEIPEDKSIINYLPKGILIELSNDSLKKIFERKKNNYP